MNTLRHKHPIITVLFWWSVFFLVLVVLRMHMSDTLTRGFLVWNLFLAWIPIGCMYVSRMFYRFRYFWSIVWFLFLPNAFYLVTDLKHLSSTVPFRIYWLDMMIFFFAAVLGMLLGVAALQEMKKLIQTSRKKYISHLLIFGSLLLSGYGIYLGRFPRMNSWYLFSQPVAFFSTIFTSIKTLLTTQGHVFFVLLFTVSFMVFYYGYEYIDEHLIRI